MPCTCNQLPGLLPRPLFLRRPRPQGVKHFKDIQYAPGVTYGEMFLQNEYEMSGEVAPQPPAMHTTPAHRG